MIAVPFIVTGGAELRGALLRMATDVDAATRVATSKTAQLVKTEMQKQLKQTTHEKGTPTPSAPGAPPSLVTGQLRRSIRVETRKLAPGLYQARIGPTAVYGRVQELGGAAGRERSVSLPSRPFVKPAQTKLIDSGALARTYRELWRAAMGL